MAYYAMGDLHLSGNPPKKPMHIFNPHWENHHLKIADYWQQVVQPEDTVFLVGDISWAARLEEAQEDLDFICNLPGKKIMIRGNHDYWWSSKTKMTRVTEGAITFLQADALELDDVIIAGTRGYLCPGDTAFKASADSTIYRRELLRMEMALEEMGNLKTHSAKKTLFLMHYPPFNDRQEATGFTELLEKYAVDHCVYGHLHTFESHHWIPKTWGTTQLHLVSSNFIDFKVKKIPL